MFGDKQSIHYSMALVTAVMGLSGCALVAYGLRSFRASLARVDWR